MKGDACIHEADDACIDCCENCPNCDPEEIGQTSAGSLFLFGVN